jgi:hypothetical protein
MKDLRAQHRLMVMLEQLGSLGRWLQGIKATAATGADPLASPSVLRIAGHAQPWPQAHLR